MHAKSTVKKFDNDLGDSIDHDAYKDYGPKYVHFVIW